MAELIVKTTVEESESLSVELLDNDITVVADDVVNIGGSGTSDYEKLYNLPSINGTTLIGNYDERDPTVPDWAKDNLKPIYSADDVGAVDARNEISFADIKSLWDIVFSEGD